MATRDLTASLLKRMEEGSAEIYRHYENLIRESEKAYKEKEKALDREYAAEANAASARAKIDLNNTLERMADSGYVHGGETVQASISANASRNNALSALATQKARDKAALRSEASAAASEYALAASQEALEYEKETADLILEQENRDREFEAEERRWAQENSLAREKWEYEKASDEKEEADSDEGIVPKKSAYDYFDGIVERNTRYEPGKNYKVIDRKAIKKALSEIVRDEKLALSYRYEMYLYAKSMGYVED